MTGWPNWNGGGANADCCCDASQNGLGGGANGYELKFIEAVRSSDQWPRNVVGWEVVTRGKERVALADIYVPSRE